MNHTYDERAHALYVTLGEPIQPGSVAKTVVMNADVLADLDVEGCVLGVEILNPWPKEAKTGA